MKIRVGFEITYDFVARTPMMLMLNVHPSARRRHHRARPASRLARGAVHALSRRIRQRLHSVWRRRRASWKFSPTLWSRIRTADAVEPAARQHEIAELPHDALVFLLASRYCETERLMEAAWSRFGQTPPGWGARVQAICDFVHSHVRFGYQHARATKTATDVIIERRGVQATFAHLAITLCRCMNIPRATAPVISGDTAFRRACRWISAPGLRSSAPLVRSTPVTTFPHRPHRWRIVSRHVAFSTTLDRTCSSVSCIRDEVGGGDGALERKVA